VSFFIRFVFLKNILVVSPLKARNRHGFSKKGRKMNEFPTFVSGDKNDCKG